MQKKVVEAKARLGGAKAQADRPQAEGKKCPKNRKSILSQRKPAWRPKEKDPT